MNLSMSLFQHGDSALLSAPYYSHNLSAHNHFIITESQQTSIQGNLLQNLQNQIFENPRNYSSKSRLDSLATILDIVRFGIQRISVPIVTAIGLLGNLATIVVMSHRRMSSSRSISSSKSSSSKTTMATAKKKNMVGVVRHTHTAIATTMTTHVYLAALAACDALYLVMVFLLSLKHYPAIKTRTDPLSAAIRAYWRCYPALMYLCDAASNTSTWLTMCFTIERYIVIRYPLKAKSICTTSRAVRAILLIGAICFAATIPTYFEWTSDIDRFETKNPNFPNINFTTSNLNLSISDNYNGSRVSKNYDCTRRFRARSTSQANFDNNPKDQNYEIIVPKNSDLAFDAAFRAAYYWSTAIGFVFVPLAVLAIVNLFLIRSVRRSGARRRRWIAGIDYQWSNVSLSAGTSVLVKNNNNNINNNNNNNGFTSTSSVGRILLRRDTHITRLLVAIVLLFLICQLPTACVTIYAATLQSPAGKNCAEEIILQTLGNVFNLLMAINAAGNFALYCALSRKYRRTLRDMIQNFAEKYRENHFKFIRTFIRRPLSRFRS